MVTRKRKRSKRIRIGHHGVLWLDLGEARFPLIARKSYHRTAVLGNGRSATICAKGCTSVKWLVDAGASVHLGQRRTLVGNEETVAGEPLEREEEESQPIHLLQSSAGSIEADHVAVEQSAVQTILGALVDIRQSLAGLVRGEEVRLSTSAAVVAAGEAVGLDGSTAVVAAGNEVHVENGRVFLLVANTVEGSVQTVLDRETAIAFGAAAGLVGGVFCLAKALLRRRG
jgi:hypothetical protein